MPAVNFPRDAQGRIITDPTVPEPATPADTPPVSSARPLRAIDPRLHVAPERAGAPAAAPSQPLTNRLQLALAAVAALLLVAALIALMGRIAPDAPVRPLAAPTTALTAVPTATPFGIPLAAALVAYFDYQRPDTATALERGTRVQPIARIAREWVLLEMADHTNVWVRGRDLPALALDSLPDRATSTPLPPTDTPAPTTVPLFMPPPAPVPTDAPVATPAPTNCVVVDAGSECGPGIDPHDPAIATSIAATAAAYNAPFQQAYNATATALSRLPVIVPR